MATETAVHLNIPLANANLTIVASTAKKAMDEAKKFGITFSNTDMTVDTGDEDVPPEAEEAAQKPVEQPKPEPEAAPEPEPVEETTTKIDEPTLRKKVEELVQMVPMGPAKAIQIMRDLEAFDKDGNPKLSALSPDKYADCYERAEAAVKELGASKGSVL